MPGLATPKSKPNSNEDLSVIDALVTADADPNARDKEGNISLHYATAWGNLKAVRALIHSGAIPMSKNNDGWTPNSYSLTVQAEVYYKGLVAEWDKRLEEDTIREHERRTQSSRSVRLVSADDSDELLSDASRSRADSDRSHATSHSGSTAGLGISNAQDAWAQ
jgi:uncharacterized protein